MRKYLRVPPEDAMIHNVDPPYIILLLNVNVWLPHSVMKESVINHYSVTYFGTKASHFWQLETVSYHTSLFLPLSYT
jgi:hypothetical protein